MDKTVAPVCVRRVCRKRLPRQHLGPHLSIKTSGALLWHLMGLQLLLGVLSSNSSPTNHHRHPRAWWGSDSRSFGQRSRTERGLLFSSVNNFNVLSMPGKNSRQFCQLQRTILFMRDFSNKTSDALLWHRKGFQLRHPILTFSSTSTARRVLTHSFGSAVTN